eukprot:4710624-Amphidinium_carterae.1
MAAMPPLMLPGRLSQKDQTAQRIQQCLKPDTGTGGKDTMHHFCARGILAMQLMRSMNGCMKVWTKVREQYLSLCNMTLQANNSTTDNLSDYS